MQQRKRLEGGGRVEEVLLTLASKKKGEKLIYSCFKIARRKKGGKVKKKLANNFFLSDSRFWTLNGSAG